MQRLVALTAVALVGAFVAAGCRQVLGIDDRTVLEEEPPPSLELPTADQIAAARPIAERDCAAMEACVPVSFAGRFADHDDCVEKDAVFWAAHFFGPDSGATAEQVAACAETVPKTVSVNGDVKHCDAWATWNLVAGPAGCSRIGVSVCSAFATASPGPGFDACFPKGARVTGAACGSGAQCATGLCTFGQTPGNPCGTCVSPAGLGKKCGLGGTDSWCDAGQYCQNTCFGLSVEAFDSCNAIACGPDNVCFSGQCKPLKGAGDTGCAEGSWSATSSQSCSIDLVCNAVDGPAHCEAPHVQALGATCGYLDREGGAVGMCALGGRCVLGSSGGAHCEPEIPLGSACTTATLFGDACAYPGVCVGGICQPRGPLVCPTP